MNLKEISIFPTYYAHDYLNIDRSKIENFCKSLRNSGAGHQEVNGWQSGDVQLDDVNLKELILNIELRLHQAFKTFGFSDNYSLKIKNGWFNINSPGTSQLNSTPPHLHTGCFLSGVFYIKSSEDSSKLTMLSTVPTLEHMTPIDAVQEFNIWNSSRWITNPTPGKLILFPSWVIHYVDGYSKDERISFAFNTILVKS